MIGFSTVLMTPKITATTISVPALEAVLWPDRRIPGTAQAAMPSAIAETMTPITCLMAVFLQHATRPTATDPRDRRAEVSPLVHGSAGIHTAAALSAARVDGAA